MTSMAKDLSDEFKLSVRSTSEVAEVLGVMAPRIAMDRSIRFRGVKKPTRAAVVNALLLWAGDLPLPELRRVIGEGMNKLSAVLGVDEADEGLDDGPLEIAVDPGPEPAKPKRKPKAG